MKRKTEAGRKMYELTEEEYSRPITKEEARQCKHRLERRWYRRLVELNILMIVLVVGVCIYNWNDNMKQAKQVLDHTVEEVTAEIEKSDDETEETGETDKKEDGEKTLLDLEEDDIPMEMWFLLYGILLYLALLVSIYYYYAYYRSMALRITEKKFSGSI